MPTGFVPPTFNLLYDRWLFPNFPSTGAPDIVGKPCQLYFNSKGLLDLTPGDNDLWVPPVFLRVPSDIFVPAVLDTVGILLHAPDYYRVRWVQVVHAGFANEYYSCILDQCTANGATPR